MSLPAALVSVVAEAAFTAASATKDSRFAAPDSAMREPSIRVRRPPQKFDQEYSCLGRQRSNALVGSLS